MAEHLLVNILALQNETESLLFAYPHLFEMRAPFHTVSQKMIIKCFMHLASFWNTGTHLWFMLRIFVYFWHP